MLSWLGLRNADEKEALNGAEQQPPEVKSERAVKPRKPSSVHTRMDRLEATQEEQGQKLDDALSELRAVRKHLEEKNARKRTGDIETKNTNGLPSPELRVLRDPPEGEVDGDGEASGS